MRTPALTLMLSLWALPACAAPDPVPSSGLALERIAAGLDRPVQALAPPGDRRLFIVEQPGRIRILADGRLRPTPFLDLTDRVRAGGERGLLSVAFHPRFATNRHLYVNYTDRRGDTQVVRFTVGSDSDRVDPATARPILTVSQPYSNHNGGLVAFGPDGMLYVGMGDGGSGGDPQGHAQDLGSLLGKMLRLDVDGGDPYRVPADNPFVARAGARGEIWAFGLRNPWRFAFDPKGGRLYVADVGQNRWEEVDVVAADRPGLDYGWNVLEGDECYRAAGCERRGRVAPAVTYGRGDGCSVTGGVVYRGARIPELAGHYLYADYCGGWIRSFKLEGEAVTRHRVWRGVHAGAVTSFGTDGAGEAVVVAHDGTVYRVVRAAGRR